MATGDIKGNIAQLERSLRHLKYPAAVDDVGLMLGDPLASLPILNFALLKYSRHVAAYVVAVGGELQAKTDEGFVKAAFRLCREHLGIRTVLTPAQFLEQGYAERKVLLLCDVVKAARELHAAGAKQERAKLQAACRQSPARMQQLSASPNTKVEWGSLASSSRLRKLPDTTATDASQSIFAPMGSVEKHRSPASKLMSQAANSRAQQRLQFSSPIAAAAHWACDTSPSQDQLIAAGLMPVSSWRSPAAAAGPAAAAAALGPAAAAHLACSPPAASFGRGIAPVSWQHKQPQHQQQLQPVAGFVLPHDQQQVQQQQQQQWQPAEPNMLVDQELQQDSEWEYNQALSAQQSPAGALPQQQVWVPVQQAQEEQDPQWQVDQEQWVPVQQQQQPAARTCLWPKQQQQQAMGAGLQPTVQLHQQAGAAQQEQPQHAPARRMPPPPLQQNKQQQVVPAGLSQQPQQQQPQQQQLQQQQQQQQELTAHNHVPAGRCKQATTVPAVAQSPAEGRLLAAGQRAQHILQQRVRQQQQQQQQQGSVTASPQLQISREQEEGAKQLQQQQQQQLPLHQQSACQQRLEQQQQRLSSQQEQQQQDYEELLSVQGEQQVALTDAQQAIVQLQEALARAEAQLEEHRSVSGHFAESVGARMTVLEGRVKLMEAQAANSRRCCPVCHARGQEHAEGVATAVGRPHAGGSGSGLSIGTQNAWLHHSPLKSPEQAAPGGANWRAAASAAASAVMTGLSSSPQPHSTGQPGWRSPYQANSSSGAAGAAGAGPRQLHAATAQQARPLAAADAATAAESRPGTGSKSPAAAAAVATAATGSAGAVRSQAGVGSQSAVPGRWPRSAPPARAAASAAGSNASGGPNTPQAAAGDAAGGADLSGSSNTSRLINQLASRAAEAQRLLDSLHVRS